MLKRQGLILMLQKLQFKQEDTMSNESYKFSKVQDALFHILSGLDFLIVYDCETTGFQPAENHIIQLSARLCCVMKDGFLEEVGQAEWYINPGYCLPDKITELTGISDEFLREKPFEKEVFQEIANFFAGMQFWDITIINLAICF